jgi:hypothetical protein
MLALQIGHDLSAAKRLPAGRAEQLLRGVEEIVFAVRERGKNDHYCVSFGNWCGIPGKWEYGRGGRLCRLNVRTRRTRQFGSHGSPRRAGTVFRSLGPAGASPQANAEFPGRATG